MKTNFHQRLISIDVKVSKISRKNQDNCPALKFTCVKLLLLLLLYSHIHSHIEWIPLKFEHRFCSFFSSSQQKQLHVLNWVETRFRIHSHLQTNQRWIFFSFYLLSRNEKKKRKKITIYTYKMENYCFSINTNNGTNPKSV